MNSRGKWRGFTRLWLCVASASVLLSGCWDRREVNDIAFIIAMSVDKEEDGKYRLGVQIPLVGSLGSLSGGGGGTSGTKSYYVDSAVGKTLREAQAILQSRMSRIHYFAHYRVVVIGSGLAKAGISKPFDIITRFPENRLTSFVVMSEGKGIELLEAQPQFERFSGEALRELVKAVTIPVSIKDVAQMTSTPGVDMFLPVFKTADTQPKGKSKEIEAMGIAAFRGDKLVKIYSRSDAVGIRWFQRYFNPFSLVISMGKTGWISTEILKGHVTIKPSIKQDHIHYDVHVYASTSITEDMSTLNLDDHRTIHETEKRISEEIVNKVNYILKDSKKHRFDPCGLGVAFAKQYPKKWKDIYSKRWREELSRITFQIHSEIEVTNLGKTTKRIMKEGL